MEDLMAWLTDWQKDKQTKWSTSVLLGFVVWRIRHPVMLLGHQISSESLHISSTRRVQTSIKAGSPPTFNHLFLLPPRSTLHKISSQSGPNFLTNVGHRQTNAIENIISLSDITTIFYVPYGTLWFCCCRSFITTVHNVVLVQPTHHLAMGTVVTEFVR